MRYLAVLVLLAGIIVASSSAQEKSSALPSDPLAFGAFVAEFGSDGALRIEGEGWPALVGTWRVAGSELTVSTAGVERDTVERPCAAPGRYRFEVDGARLEIRLIEDPCTPRRLILGTSSWRPVGEAVSVPPREILLTKADTSVPLPEPAPASGSWPSFRGKDASGVAKRQRLSDTWPDIWDASTGDNILWKRPIPGLAHSSPIVWGERVFVVTAVSSLGNATFRPGLYGDGDASEDRSSHQWMLMALHKRTGAPLWTRVVHEGEPVAKRHIKSTYASATPATDGRIVVASFGSQGVFAYDVDGRFRWHVDLGHIDLGAYDIPSFEWGPASSPILWNGLVFVQCDTQADSFLLALDAATGEMVWKTERDEPPSWGTPSVYDGESGAELLTNASNFLRGYDPATGRELWRLGGSSKITAPTPVFSGSLIVFASGRRPEKPIFVVRAGTRGNVTLEDGATENAAVLWSRTNRGSYMPTPLIYDGVLYVLGNNGVFDAYELASGEEIYRSRVPHLGSGFSASPVAADGKIYLSNEDGDIAVVAAGKTFDHIATNSMGELLMATPALSEGVLYVRSSRSLYAIGRTGAGARASVAK